MSPLPSLPTSCMLYIVLAMQGGKMLDVASAELFLSAVNVVLAAADYRNKGISATRKQADLLASSKLTF